MFTREIMWRKKFSNVKKKKKKIHHNLIFPPPPDAALHFRKSNGVMNHEFAEVYTVRASSPFSAFHRGGLCCGSSCGNFVRHIQGQIPELQRRPAYSPTWKKERRLKKKKSGKKTGGGEIGWPIMKLHADRTCKLRILFPLMKRRYSHFQAL